MNNFLAEEKSGKKKLACKICPEKTFSSSSAFMSHLTASHTSIEGGSYTCNYGDNKICNACPAVGISQSDYVGHVNRHHLQVGMSRQSVDRGDRWGVYNSTVNLPAALNDPGKGKQKDFFTRSWGVEFVDSTLLPPSPHICQLPPNSFDRYLRKVRRYYSKHSIAGIVQQSSSANHSPSSSRETTPSPLPPQSPGGGPSSSPARTPFSTPPRPSLPHKLDVPSVFLDQNFDLSNPATFNTVFPFLQDSLNDNSRLNPFQLDTGDVKQVEKSGKLTQERLSHHLDQVEVSIAHQVAAKSHHFFQVMTYHDALMSQLIALITVVRTLRERLADVEKGVVLALKVPQLCLRKQNLGLVLQTLNTVNTLHQTQPTIQVLLSRQEFAGALDLIATSQDIVKDNIGDLLALKHLPGQLSELMEIIGRMLLSDFKNIVNTELIRDIKSVRGTVLAESMEPQELENGANPFDCEEISDCQIDEFALGSVVSGLIRQRSFSFLEFFEEFGINAIKHAIKDVVLEILDLTEEKTLTNLVAEFALIATPEGWTDLLDYLFGSLIISLRRMDVVYCVILSTLDARAEEEEAEANNNCDNPSQNDEVPKLKLKGSANEVMINICDQVHERLGKLVTVRSRPNAVKLITPAELSRVQLLINTLSQVTQGICGKGSAGLQLSHQGQTILFIQQFHEAARSRVAAMLEGEKWRQFSCSRSVFDGLAEPLSGLITPSTSTGAVDTDPAAAPIVQHLRIEGTQEPFTFVESLITFLTILSSYCTLLRELPAAASTEVGLKIADLLKLFNSRTCQLVLGAGAVSLAGLKTITIRNLAVTLRSLAVLSHIIPRLRSNIMDQFHNLTEKQTITIGRNFDHAAKDYADHLGELERKIIQIVDAALQQQLNGWERRPPVPSSSFKAIGKQLTKLHEAIQDILPPSHVCTLFRSIHNQFLRRVADKLKQSKLRPDNSPTHGLVVSELIFYRENLKYMNVLDPQDLIDSNLQTVWSF